MSRLPAARKHAIHARGAASWPGLALDALSSHVALSLERLIGVTIEPPASG